MTLHSKQIRDEIRKHSNKAVEERAIMEAVQFFEKEISEFVLQIVKEHIELNKFRTIQGLQDKKRIGVEAVSRAIDKRKKTNQKPPYNLAGDDKKETENEESASAINEKKEVS